MPPNLGGFFMVRSYYPSECHADYFDFERIEALKPAIEACGISTLSQSPMLGFHKQMDNRIKLLEEILSFRMQGVEFDNGDMYVDGHKAASDVRDEFVSVTEKLMDELAQCYNVLPQLDINNTIDHRPEGDEKWFLENEKTVTQFCRKLAAERPLKDIRDEYNYPKKKGIKDECSRLLEASTMKSRRGFAIQRSEERFSRNAETDLVCRLLLEKKKGAAGEVRSLGRAAAALDQVRFPLGPDAGFHSKPRGHEVSARNRVPAQIVVPRGCVQAPARPECLDGLVRESVSADTERGDVGPGVPSEGWGSRDYGIQGGPKGQVCRDALVVQGARGVGGLRERCPRLLQQPLRGLRAG